MSLKKSLIATAVWMTLIIAAFIAVAFYMQSHPIRGLSMEERGKMVGTGMGTLASIGLAVIWLPFAARLGKERREAKQSRERRRSR